MPIIKTDTSGELGITYGSVPSIQVYKDYLRSKHWRKVKNWVYQEKRYQCYLCNERKLLQIHHITYENIGKEKIDDLIYLCPRHHRYVTFSKEKEVVQKWFERIRLRNLKQRQKFGGKLIPKSVFKRKYRSGISPIKFHKRNKMQKYAGLFTWKAEELKNG